jgi:hypothetical protein
MVRKRANIEDTEGKLKVLEACDSKECSVCQEWSKKTNIWKTFHFFPLHCYNCEFAGKSDDFKIIHRIMGTLVCNQCYNKYLLRIKDILKH